MQVILLERIEKLGQMGDVVDVKPGYARNFLMPKGKAMRATKDNLEQFEQRRGQLEATNIERRGEAETLAGRAEDFACILLRQASDSAQLYGSVTARDIAEAITDGGVTLHRTQVMLDRPIKMLGIHTVRVALHPEVIIDAEVNVARTAEEAEAQAEAAARGEAMPTLDEAEAVFEAVDEAEATEDVSADAGGDETDAPEASAAEAASEADAGDEDAGEAEPKD
jgi:large subunit ribosomal protein L9